MSYLVYIATSPSNKVYIGMTKKSLQARRKEHEWHCKSNKSRKIFHFALKKYELDFTWKEIEIGLSKEEAEIKEIEYIAKFKATDGNFGYNQTKGGLAGDIRTEESKAKWKEKMQKHWDDPEYCKRLSDSQKKMLLNDPDHKERLGSYMKKYYENTANRTKNSEMLNKINKSRWKREFMAKIKGGKPFICIETNERFELLQDAADRFGVDKRNIHNVLKRPKRYKTILRKYTFRYLEQKKL